jgi:hypothetical protein
VCGRANGDDPAVVLALGSHGRFAFGGVAVRPTRPRRVVVLSPGLTPTVSVSVACRPTPVSYFNLGRQAILLICLRTVSATQTQRNRLV